MIHIARTFNNSKELITAIKSDTEQALNHTANLTKDLIEDFINQWYLDYSPLWYQRTYQLLNSITRTEVIKQSNKMSVSVYLDESLLHYSTDEQGILTAANNGLHGSIYNHFEKGERNIRLWSDAENEIRDKELIFKAFEDYLKNKGICVKRK